jgi:hypothetical protein
VTYFGPLPEPELDLGAILRFVQYNLNTFYRAISFSGNLRSTNWDGGANLSDGAIDGVDPDATQGFLIDSQDGSAHFAGGLSVGRFTSTSTVIYIDATGGISFAATMEELEAASGQAALVQLSSSTSEADFGAVLDIQSPIYEPDSIYGAILSLGRAALNDSDAIAFNFGAATSGATGGAETWDTFVNVVANSAPVGAGTALRVQHFGTGDIQRWVDSGGNTVASVTAAGLLGAVKDADGLNENVAGFTNTSYADLDALTTAAFSRGVTASATTGTTALVVISVNQIVQATSGTCLLSYRVSGASTIASDDTRAVRVTTSAARLSSTFVSFHSGLTAGANVFELQARVTANSADLVNPTIAVIPL